MPKPTKTALVYFIQQRSALLQEKKTAKGARLQEIERLLGTLAKEIKKLDDNQK